LIKIGGKHIASFKLQALTHKYGWLYLNSLETGEGFSTISSLSSST
jgi:hypothetical protein